MAHLGAYVGSSWRSCSPSCLSCSPSWRRHGQQFEAKCHLRANIIEDSPQDASATPSEHPKSAKNKENVKFFNVFHSPAMVPKSIKNAPRTVSEAPKLSPKWQSCRYHGPSYSLCWLILALLLTILPLLFAILAPACATIQRKMHSSSQHPQR